MRGLYKWISHLVHGRRDRDVLGGCAHGGWDTVLRAQYALQIYGMNKVSLQTGTDHNRNGKTKHMIAYYASRYAQANGDHEIHRAGCANMPIGANRLYLGDFPNCFSALREAKKYYQRSSGCRLCSPECHTT